MGRSLIGFDINQNKLRMVQLPVSYTHLTLPTKA